MQLAALGWEVSGIPSTLIGDRRYVALYCSGVRRCRRRRRRRRRRRLQ